MELLDGLEPVFYKCHESVFKSLVKQKKMPIVAFFSFVNDCIKIFLYAFIEKKSALVLKILTRKSDIMKKIKLNLKHYLVFMELMPQDQILFLVILKRTIEEVYASYGYYELDTPIIESSEVLLAKAGGETEKQIYRFQKGDSDLSLRFDLTVPLAKYVAARYNELTFPFKRYQIGKVYRGERAQKGRFREFYQCDIDVIGNESLSLMYDVEIPSVIYDIFLRN
ncbi:MAG: ATP phosphoribosyltransferase regulatory subunit [Clostridium sp.]|nr:MAG: ATP phosphoribosyltransferase regulatory subunit [Clostridium sp.]